MQIQKQNGDLLTLVWYENRLIEMRLNQPNKDGHMRPVKKKVFMFEPEILPPLIEALIAFDREGRCQHDSNRQCKSQAQ